MNMILSLKQIFYKHFFFEAGSYFEAQAELQHIAFLQTLVWENSYHA